MVASLSSDRSSDRGKGSLIRSKTNAVTLKTSDMFSLKSFVAAQNFQIELQQVLLVLVSKDNIVILLSNSTVCL